LKNHEGTKTQSKTEFEQELAEATEVHSGDPLRYLRSLLFKKAFVFLPFLVSWCLCGKQLASSAVVVMKLNLTKTSTSTRLVFAAFGLGFLCIAPKLLAEETAPEATVASAEEARILERIEHNWRARQERVKSFHFAMSTRITIPKEFFKQHRQENGRTEFKDEHYETPRNQLFDLLRETGSPSGKEAK
jgi:hypothetical protein